MPLKVSVGSDGGINVRVGGEAGPNRLANRRGRLVAHSVNLSSAVVTKGTDIDCDIAADVPGYNGDDGFLFTPAEVESSVTGWEVVAVADTVELSPSVAIPIGGGPAQPSVDYNTGTDGPESIYVLPTGDETAVAIYARPTLDRDEVAATGVQRGLSLIVRGIGIESAPSLGTTTLRFYETDAGGLEGPRGRQGIPGPQGTPGSSAPAVSTDLGYADAVGGGTVTSSTGTDAALPLATTARAGLQSPQDKTKIDGVEEDATRDQTGQEIVADLVALTGQDKLPATAVRDLPSPGGPAGPVTKLDHLDAVPPITGYAVDDIVNVEGDLLVLVDNTDQEHVLRGVAGSYAGSNYVGAARNVTGHTDVGSWTDGAVVAEVSWILARDRNLPIWDVYLDRNAVGGSAPANLYMRFYDADGNRTDATLTHSTVNDVTSAYAYRSSATADLTAAASGTAFRVEFYGDAAHTAPSSVHGADRWERFVELEMAQVAQASTTRLDHLDLVPDITGYDVDDVINVEGDLLVLVDDADEGHILRGVSGAFAGGNYFGTSRNVATLPDVGSWTDGAVVGQVSWASQFGTGVPLWNCYLSKTALRNFALANLWMRHVADTGETTEVALVHSPAHDVANAYNYRSLPTGVTTNTRAGDSYRAEFYTDMAFANPARIHQSDRWERFADIRGVRGKQGIQGPVGPQGVPGTPGSTASVAPFAQTGALMNAAIEHVQDILDAFDGGGWTNAAGAGDAGTTHPFVREQTSATQFDAASIVGGTWGQLYTNGGVARNGVFVAVRIPNVYAIAIERLRLRIGGATPDVDSTDVTRRPLDGAGATLITSGSTYSYYSIGPVDIPANDSWNVQYGTPFSLDTNRVHVPSFTTGSATGRLVARTTVLPTAAVARGSNLGPNPGVGNNFAFDWTDLPSGYSKVFNPAPTNDHVKVLFAPLNPPADDVFGLWFRAKVGDDYKHTIGPFPWGPGATTEETATDDFTASTLLFGGGGTNDGNALAKVIVKWELTADGYTAILLEGDGTALPANSIVEVYEGVVRGGRGVPGVGVTQAALVSNRYVKANAGGTELEAGYAIVRLTQAAYDALAVKDANTLYIIIG